MRKAISAALCLLLSAVLVLPVNAAQSGEFLRRKYDITEQSACFYSRELPAGGELLVTVDGKKVENPTQSTLEQAEVPVTVYCLVDTSTSMGKNAVQQQEDILKTISSRMRAQDNMVLGFLDESLIEGKALSDREARNTAIDTMRRSVWFTNLYQGVLESVDSLCTNTTYHPNSCLLILSDGHDDGRTNVSADQVLDTIRGAGIPVYSVLVGIDVTDQDSRQQKWFADASLGGFCLCLSEENLSAAAAAEKVWDSVLNGTVIQFDREALGDTGADRTVMVRYEAGETRYEDTAVVRAVDIPEAVPPTEQETTEQPEAEEEASEDEKALPVWVYAAAGAGVLVIAAAAALVLRAKRKKALADQKEQSEQTQQEEAEKSGIIFSEEEINVEALSVTTPITPVDGPELEQTQSVSGGCDISMVAIMHPEISVNFHLFPEKELTFGRDDRADVILNSGDSKLSGVHASFLWSDGILLLRDKGSTNGTQLNGEPCFVKTWMKVEDGAKIRAGVYEYRVTYQLPGEQ